MVLMISTFYTGCAPGRFIAPQFSAFCAEQKLLHPGQFECITSLKGSNSCEAWTSTYMNLDDNAGMPQVVQDTDSALHYTFFDGNPQFVVLDHSAEVQVAFDDDAGLYVDSNLDFTGAAAELIAELVAGVPLTADVIEGGSDVQTMDVEWFMGSTYAPMTANVGDTVNFWWDPGQPAVQGHGDHDVQIHPSGSCDDTDAIYIGADAAGTPYTFNEADVGEVTFACDMWSGGHCASGQIVTFTISAADDSGDEPDTLSSMTCAPSFGQEYAVQVEFTAEHGLSNPRDMQFHPLDASKLWVANHDSDDIAMIDVAAGTSQNRWDRSPYHYMEKITSLSFDATGKFATCQDSLNAYNGMQAPNHFMGPTLYDSDEGALVDQIGNGACDTEDPSTTCFFSHIDMLHESPQCVGITHDSETVSPFGNVYWMFDGLHGHLVRFDFSQPHGPGSLDHSVAAIRRFPDIALTRVEGVPSHLMMDPDSRVLYIVDTGGGRILRMDPDSGNFLRTAKVEYPIYSSLAETFEYSIWGCADWEVFVDGLNVPSGLHISDGVVYVGERNTSRIIAFDKATREEITSIQTGALGLNGFDIDQAGQLWFSDGPSNTVSRVMVEQACESSGMEDDATSEDFVVDWPQYECTDVVDTELAPTATEHIAGYMNLSAFIGIDDYADAEIHHCGGNSITLGADSAGMPTADEDGNYLINNDALLMSGFICHICLPEPCLNGGWCTHVPGGEGGVFVYNGEERDMSGFTCECPAGFGGDMCQLAMPVSCDGADIYGDINGSGMVDVEDILLILQNFGGELGDLEAVDMGDLLEVLAAFGDGC